MKIVIVNCFDTYEHRAELLFHAFQEKGHRVEVFASDFCHIEKKRREGGKKGFRYFRTLPYTKNMSLQRLYSHVRLSRIIFKTIEKQADTIDLLWVFVPPNSFAERAGKIKKKYPRMRLVLDMIDLWPETMPVNAWKSVFPLRLWGQIRNVGLKNADFITVECNLYKKTLGSILDGKRVETLYLARQPVEYKPQLHLPDDRISLCYLGSMNHIIDIDLIGRIIRACKKHKPVILHMIGSGENRERFIQVCADAGAVIVYHGKIYDRKEKQRIFDSCHYGLNIMKGSVCVGFTMKSVDYLEYGLPMINNIRGDTWEAVERYGIGLNWREGCFKADDGCGRRHACRAYFEKFLSQTHFEKKVQKIIQMEE